MDHQTNPLTSAFVALLWLDPDITEAEDWDRARMRRLARHLGYQPVDSLVVSWAELVNALCVSRVDTLLIPAPNHVDAMGLNALLAVADVETVLPRLSFHRWGPSPAMDWAR